MGELIYTLSLEKGDFDRGIVEAERKIKVFEKTTNDSGIKIKSLAKDVGVLGGSLASMGGIAILAGSALGDEGLGSALTTTGMGMAVVGGALATVVPALKGMSVVVEGTLIPALIKLNAFLGPAGWIVLGVSAVTAVIGTYIYMQDQAKKSMDNYSSSAGTAAQNVGALKDALEEVDRIQKEMAGMPETVAELSHRKTGLMNQRSRAFARLAEAKATGIPLDISEALWDIEGIDMELGKVSSKMNESINRYRYGLPGELQFAQNVAGAIGAPSGTFQFQGLGGFNGTLTPGASMGVTRTTTPIQIIINGTVKDETFNVTSDTLGAQAAQKGYI